NAVVLPAALEAFGPSLATRAPGVAAKHLRFDARDRRARRKTQRNAQRGRVAFRVVMSFEDFRATKRLRQKLVESRRARFARNKIEGVPAFARGPEFGERRVARLGELPLRFGLVENLEMR